MGQPRFEPDEMLTLETSAGAVRCRPVDVGNREGRLGGGAEIHAVNGRVPDPDAPRSRLALESEIKAESGDDHRGCPFKGRCHRKLGPICDAEFPPLRTAGPGHVALCHIPVDDLPTAATRTGAAQAQPVS